MQRLGEWLMSSTLGQKLNLEVSLGVLSAKCSHQLFVDVEGGARIDDSLLAMSEEGDCV